MSTVLRDILRGAPVIGILISLVVSALGWAILIVTWPWVFGSFTIALLILIFAWWIGKLERMDDEYRNEDKTRNLNVP